MLPARQQRPLSSNPAQFRDSCRQPDQHSTRGDLGLAGVQWRTQLWEKPPVCRTLSSGSSTTSSPTHHVVEIQILLSGHNEFKVKFSSTSCYNATNESRGNPDAAVSGASTQDCIIHCSHSASQLSADLLRSQLFSNREKLL